MHGAAAVLKIPHITRSVSSREVDTQLCQGTVSLDGPAQVGKHSRNMSERPQEADRDVRADGRSYLRGLWQWLLNNESMGGVAGDLSAMQNLANVYRPTLLNFINYFWESR